MPGTGCSPRSEPARGFYSPAVAKRSLSTTAVPTYPVTTPLRGLLMSPLPEQAGQDRR